MNSTLTGLGIALVVALVTALIGPFFIDWTDHRAAFEAQASRLLGVPVKVKGEVDARILPSPRIRFSHVVAGDELAASKLTADSFSLDIALMPMLAGEFQVTSMRIDGADLKASLSVDGEVSLPIAAGGMTLEGLDAIKITNLDVRDARITVADPGANRHLVIDKIDLQGEAASLAGPMKLDARGTVGERTYSFHAATGRFDKSGQGRVKLTLDSKDAPALTLDGTLLLSSKPGFQGSGSLVQTPAAEGQPEREPWKIAGDVTADIRTLEADKVDFEYGAPGRELRLSGGLGLNYGRKPSAEIRLKGKQIDLDRALGRAKDQPALPPAEALAVLAQRFPAATSAPLPLRVTADVENVLLGGDLVQTLRGAVSSTPGGWTVENLSARLPGGAVMETSGALMLRDGEGPRFTGPAKLDAPNMPSLVHWLEGLAEKRPAVALKKLRLEAALSARPGSYALDDMRANIDGADVKGRLAFTDEKESRNRLEARLTAETLDLDALDPARLSRFVGTSKGTDVELALRAQKLTYAKVVWSGVDVDLSSESGAVDIRRLTINDLGGAKIVATGSLSKGASAPAGKLEARVEAANLNGLVSVLRTSSLPPAVVDAIGKRAAVIAPASLTAELASSGGTDGVTARVSGVLGGTSLEFNARAPKFAFDGPLKATLTASSGDGARMFSQLGLPAIAVERFGATSLEINLEGDPGKNADLGLMLASSLDRVVFKGKLSSGEKPLAGRLDIALDDAARYAVLLGRAAPASLPAVPFTVGGDVSYDGKGIHLARLAGLVQGRAVKGSLSYEPKNGVRGDLEIASLSLPELTGMALGPSALGEGDGAGWPAGVPGAGLLDGLEGRVEVRTDNFEIAPGYTGGKTKFNLAFGHNEFAVHEAETVIAGGAVKGNFAFRRADTEFSLAARLAVEGAKLGELIWGGRAGPAATGGLDLTADMLGTGKTLAEVVAALTGSGSFTLHDAKFAAVDPGAFERTLIAVENGAEPPDAADIAARFTSELAMGELEVTEVSSAFTIASGVARASNAAISAPLVAATGSGSINLPARTLEASMTLRPKILADLEETAPNVDIFLKGPWNAPARSVETTAFANVLAVRAVEREIERVERMEAERRARELKAAEDEARRKAEEAEAARLKAIREATGDIPIGEIPPPLDTLPKRAETPAAGSSPPRGQSPLDFLRRPVVPEASR